MKYQYVFFFITLVLMSEVLYYFRYRESITMSAINPTIKFSAADRSALIAQLEQQVSTLPSFPRYDKIFHNSLSIIPVWIVTPATSSCIHRFFDSSPFSPSGKYIAVTCLSPGYSEYSALPLSEPVPSHVVVYDIWNQSVVANITTFGWDSQVGAHAQWGKDDAHLLFNDITNNNPRGVVYNIYTKRTRMLNNTIYHVSNDGNFAVTSSLAKIRFTQLGYGLYVQQVQPNNRSNLGDDGYYIVDISTGESSLLVSLRSLQKYLPRCFIPSISAMYGFHVKWSSDDQLIMLVLRTVMVNSHRIQHIFTITKKKRDIKYITSWSSMSSPHSSKGGHHCHVLDGNHPNWIPNTHLLSINRGITKPWDLVVFNADSGRNNYRWDAKMAVVGQSTGHPNFLSLNETDWNYIVVIDSYFKEKELFGNNIDEMVPLRLIVGNATRHTEVWLTRINNSHKSGQNAWRCDPHVTFDNSRRWIAFNARPYGKTRQVLIGYLGVDPRHVFVK